jgi:hypothetical protein
MYVHESALPMKIGLDLNIYDLLSTLLLDPWTSVIDILFFLDS